MATIRGANTGVFSEAGVFLTESQNGCPRVALLRNLKVEPAVNGESFGVFELGFTFERTYEATLQNSGVTFARDVGVVLSLTPKDSVDTLEFCGHADFVVNDEVVIETKSVSSENTLKVVKGTRYTPGQPKLAHLLQLCAYMISMDKRKGKVVYGSYTRHTSYDELKTLSPDEVKVRFEKIMPDIYEFQVSIDDEGTIRVGDRVVSEFKVQDIVAYWEELGRYILEGKLPPRPFPIALKGYDPCHFCKFRPVCDQSPVSLKEMLTGWELRTNVEISPDGEPGGERN